MVRVEATVRACRSVMIVVPIARTATTGMWWPSVFYPLSAPASFAVS